MPGDLIPVSTQPARVIPPPSSGQTGIEGTGSTEDSSYTGTSVTAKNGELNLKTPISQKTSRKLKQAQEEQAQEDTHGDCEEGFRCSTRPATYQLPEYSSCSRTCTVPNKEGGSDIKISQSITGKQPPSYINQTNLINGYQIESLAPSKNNSDQTIAIKFLKTDWTGETVTDVWRFSGKFDPTSFRNEISKACDKPQVVLEIGHNSAELKVFTTSNIFGADGLTILIGYIEISFSPYSPKQSYLDRIEARLKEFQEIIKGNIETHFGDDAGDNAQDIFQKPKYQSEHNIPNPAYPHDDGDEGDCGYANLGCIEFTTNSNNSTLFSTSDVEELAADIHDLMTQGPGLIETLADLTAGAWLGIASTVTGFGAAIKYFSSRPKTDQENQAVDSSASAPTDQQLENRV